MGATEDEFPRVSVPRLLGRGLLRRCPRCGRRGAWFTGWYAKDDRCPRCGFRWARNLVGFELGSLTVNMLMTFAVLLAGLVLAAIIWGGQLPVLPLVLVLCGLALVIPAVIYPVAHTFWAAIDLAARPLDPEEINGEAPASVSSAGAAPRQRISSGWATTPSPPRPGDQGRRDRRPSK